MTTSEPDRTVDAPWQTHFQTVIVPGLRQGTILPIQEADRLYLRCPGGTSSLPMAHQIVECFQRVWIVVPAEQRKRFVEHWAQYPSGVNIEFSDLWGHPPRRVAVHGLLAGQAHDGPEG